MQCFNCQQFGHLSRQCKVHRKTKESSESTGGSSSGSGSSNGRGGGDHRGGKSGSRTEQVSLTQGSNRFDPLSSDDDTDQDQDNMEEPRVDQGSALGPANKEQEGRWGASFSAVEIQDPDPEETDGDARVCAVRSDHSRSTPWGVDSMASLHISGDRRQFSSLRRCKPVSVLVADGNTVKATHRGTVPICVKTSGGISVIFKARNVYYHERFTTNLLSWSVLRDRGWELHSTLEKTFVVMPGGNTITLNTAGRVSMMDAISSGSGFNLGAGSASARAYSVGHLEINDVAGLVRLHERLGHMGFDRMVTIIKAGATLDVGKLSVSGSTLLEARRRVLECRGCALGKGHRTAFGHRGIDKGSAPGETLHMDTYQVPLQQGDRKWLEYGLVVTDPHAQCKWFSRLTSKDQGADAVIGIVRQAQTQCGCKVKRLYADGGTEFINQTLKAFCSEEGIVLHYPPARTQQLNGVAERSVRTNKEAARSMMLHAGTPTRFWYRAAMHATYLWNRTTVAPATGMTPFECVFKRKPSIRHWGVFGCDAFAHVPKEQRGAFAAKMEPCIYLGHDPVQNSAVVYVLRTGKLISSRDLEYREQSFTHGVALGRGDGAVADILAQGYTADDHGTKDEAALQGGWCRVLIRVRRRRTRTRMNRTKLRASSTSVFDVGSLNT